jgi:hypothetical protein
VKTNRQSRSSRAWAGAHQGRLAHVEMIAPDRARKLRAEFERIAS